jgi:hypothetical protein
MKPRVVLPVQALLVVGLLSAGLHAQSVGIGTANPDPSARLHIEDNARGLLIPNVALTGTNDVTTISNPATSLLVYNTATAGTGATAVSPGFYYWDGSQWVRLADGGNAWLLTGNAGTDPATNFLGTTDAQPLVIATTNTTTPQPIQIRVGNQETFRFNPPGASAPAWGIQRGGGNPRGLHAVDLQSARSLATQVASGDYSVIGGGWYNTASGGCATVGGGGQHRRRRYATVGGGHRATPPEASHGAPLAGAANSSTVCHRWRGRGNTPVATATIGGGRYNTASGVLPPSAGARTTRRRDYSVVPGGVAILQMLTTISSSERM